MAGIVSPKKVDETTGNFSCRKNVEKWEREAALKNQTFEIMLDPIYCYDKDAVSSHYPKGDIVIGIALRAPIHSA